MIIKSQGFHAIPRFSRAGIIGSFLRPGAIRPGLKDGSARNFKTPLNARPNEDR